MSTRILWQCNPNTSYQLVPLEEDGEATASEHTFSTISKNHGKLKKWRITKNHFPTPTDPQIQFPTPQIFQNPPTIHPIVPRYHPHTTYNSMPSNICFQCTVEPFEISAYFWHNHHWLIRLATTMHTLLPKPENDSLRVVESGRQTLH